MHNEPEKWPQVAVKYTKKRREDVDDSIQQQRKKKRGEMTIPLQSNFDPISIQFGG